MSQHLVKAPLFVNFPITRIVDIYYKYITKEMVLFSFPLNAKVSRNVKLLKHRQVEHQISSI